MSDRMTCQRRNDLFAFGQGEKGQDEWRKDGTCSYCGSVTPEAVFEAIEAGRELGPTDKSYKVYLDVPDPSAGQMRVVSAITFDPEPNEVEAEGWIRVGRRERRWLKRDGWGGTDYRWLRLTERTATKHAKFYFQHLSADEQSRFIELLNDGKIALGYPGHFYRLPFFIQRPTA